MYIKVAQGQLQGAGVHPYHINVADFFFLCFHFQRTSFYDIINQDTTV